MTKPRRTLRLSAALGAALSVLLLAGPARAGEPTLLLRATIKKVIEMLKDPSLKGADKKKERRAKMRETISARFDFTEMARRSLARHWRKRTPEERKEFTALFSSLMERSYVSKMEAYTDEVIHYGKERVDEDFARVKTVIITKKQQEIPIQYSLHKTGGEWKVYDVIIEGVSLIKTYRQQFRAIIRKTSYGDLVKKLRAKQEEG
ncbi:MAG: ABC transporter substrate-binding protein [bacterium]